MYKRPLALFFVTLISTLILNHGNVTAKPTPPQNTPEKIQRPIPLPTQSTTNSKSFRPRNISQSDRPEGKETRAIIGNDDRIPVLSRTYPWTAIGRLISPQPDGSYLQCTGTLIGRDLVLTNAHCTIDPTTQAPIANLTFQPNLIKGVALDEAKVIRIQYGTKNYEANPADDWALLKLDQPLGETYGYLGWQPLDFSDPNILKIAQDQLMLISYAGDFPTPALKENFGQPGDTAGANAGCSIEGVINQAPFSGQLLHRCDSNPGGSGGPILARFNDGNYYIVGLHAGSYTLERGSSIQVSNGDISRFINRGVQVSRWADKANTMR